MMLRLRVSIIPLSVFALACSNKNHARGAVTVRDSAGVSIMQYPGDPWQAGDTVEVSTDPVLDIGAGASDSGQQLFRVRSARRLSTGAVAVANGGTGEVRIFDQTGAFLRTLGGFGGGPGEFRSLDMIQVLMGDTILALDIDSRRITLFPPTGAPTTKNLDLGGLQPWPADISVEQGNLILPVEIDRVWQQIEKGGLQIGVVARTLVNILRVPEQGGPTETLVSFDGVELAIQRVDGTVTTSHPPFGRTFVHALSPQGFWVGDQQLPQIQKFDFRGRLRRVFRWVPHSSAVTNPAVDSYVTVLFRGMEEGPAKQAVLSRYRQSPRPLTRPAYGRLLAAGEEVWVSQSFVLGTTPGRWFMIDFSRRMISAISLPDRFEPYEAGPDYVLGKWSSELRIGP